MLLNSAKSNLCRFLQIAHVRKFIKFDDTEAGFSVFHKLVFIRKVQ